jgi:hypothetical protein
VTGSSYLSKSLSRNDVREMIKQVTEADVMRPAVLARDLSIVAREYK